MTLLSFICRSHAWCGFVLLAGCGASATQLLENGSAAPLHASTQPAAGSFVREQLRFSRVRLARSAAESSIEAMFRARKIHYPAAEMFVRVFKRERSLELWVRPVDGRRFELLHTYPICALAGILGPKRVQGDRQVPEGFYSIDLFNPASSYHLSLRIDYPNQRDRAANPEARDLGGEIFIHGGCRSDGCVAITDEAIEQLYWLAVTARGLGQAKIPVHIFPARFDNTKRMQKVEQQYHHAPAVLQFWETLRPGYDYFEQTRRLPVIEVDTRGRYHMSDRAAR